MTETSQLPADGENRTAHADPEQIVGAVAALQSGEGGEDEFHLLYKTYFPAVRGFFRKRLRSADLCLDLTQETFIRVHKGVRGYRGDGAFGAWVFRIAWNVLRRHQTTKSVSELEHKSISLDDPEPPHAIRNLAEDESQTPSENNAYASTLRSERQRILWQAVAELPEQRRKCIVLWAYHELTYEQIATVMRLSIGTVKAHLAQARQQLAQLVAAKENTT